MWCLSRTLHAALTDAPDFDVGARNAAKPLDGLGDAQGVEGGAFEIARQAAAHADVVVVVPQIGVEPHALAAGPKRRDEPQVIEQPQTPVHCVHRDGRDTTSDLPEDGVRVGMLEARRQLAEDLEALVGELDPGGLDGLLEPRDPAFHLRRVSLHD